MSKEGGARLASRRESAAGERRRISTGQRNVCRRSSSATRHAQRESQEGSNVEQGDEDGDDGNMATKSGEG